MIILHDAQTSERTLTGGPLSSLPLTYAFESAPGSSAWHNYDLISSARRMKLRCNPPSCTPKKQKRQVSPKKRCVVRLSAMRTKSCETSALVVDLKLMACCIPHSMDRTLFNVMLGLQHSD